MFKKKIEYVRNEIGKVVGVNIGKKQFRIEEYNLMMNKPSYYLFDPIGTKITNVDSFCELDMLIRKNL